MLVGKQKGERIIKSMEQERQARKQGWIQKEGEDVKTTQVFVASN